MAEITDQGYQGKTQNEYLEEERQLFLDLDPDWNLDPSTPDALKLAIDSERFGNFDEQLRLTYNSKDPARARGLDLDILCALTGTVRAQGTPSTVALTVGGTPGTIILGGKLIESTIDGSQWVIDAAVTIGPGGTSPATATCTDVGPTDASAGTLTRIVDTVGGWQSVTNPTPATLGTAEQTDPSLRLERELSVARPGNNQVDNMTGELFAVEGVRRVRVYENDTGAVDGNGLPAHSIAALVDGGTDADVALAMYRKKNPGVALHGAGTPVTENVTSPLYAWQTKDITFGRPTAVDITVAVTVQDDGSLPVGVDQEIIDAIIDYVNGTLIDSSYGFNPIGFNIGDDVAISRMYTPVNQVIGQYGQSYVTLLQLNGAASNVAIAFDELARFTSGNISVTVTP